MITWEKKILMNTQKNLTSTGSQKTEAVVSSVSLIDLETQIHIDYIKW